MLERIEVELRKLESEENVVILLAVESGSRAWGFASPDSDYDVRFVYVRKPEWYLRLDEPRDVIEWRLDDDLDISGWDVRKALRLMRGSNPSLLEWLSSPIAYRPIADSRLIGLANRSFDPVKSCHHYIHMARGNAREHLEKDKVKLKKYLYVIRPILAARHVLESRTQPPMAFSELARDYLDEDLIPIVDDLLKRKRENAETLLIPRNEALNTWVSVSLDELERRVRELAPSEKVPWEEFNDLFLALILGR